MVESWPENVRQHSRATDEDAPALERARIPYSSGPSYRISRGRSTIDIRVLHGTMPSLARALVSKIVCARLSLPATRFSPVSTFRFAEVASIRSLSFVLELYHFRPLILIRNLQRHSRRNLRDSVLRVCRRSLRIRVASRGGFFESRMCGASGTVDFSLRSRTDHHIGRQVRHDLTQ
jgi:hypothetical protein